MSVVDDLDDTEIVRREGDTYILRKKGTKLVRRVHQCELEPASIAYAQEMQRIVEEEYGQMKNELVEIIRASPHAILKAAKQMGCRIELEEEVATQYISAEIDQDERAVLSFVPPLDDPLFQIYFDRNEYYVQINYEKGQAQLHPKYTPEEKIRQTNEKVKEIVELAKKLI